MLRAEIESEDVIAEARDVLQLFEVTLQSTTGETGFVKWSHKTKHEGVQTGRPAHTHKQKQVLQFNDTSEVVLFKQGSEEIHEKLSFQPFSFILFSFLPNSDAPPCIHVTTNKHSSL